MFSVPVPTPQELQCDGFRELRNRPIADYFPANSAENPGLPRSEAIQLPVETRARFERDFVRLARARSQLQGLSRVSNFLIWWEESRARFLTTPVMNGYVENGATLGEFLDELHLHFLTGREREREGSRLARAMRGFSRHRFILTFVLSLSLLVQKFGGFLWSLAVLGPGVQMVNSYTQPVVTPLAQTVQQVGSRDLAGVASGIQGWLTHRERLKAVKEGLGDVTARLKHTNFGGLSPEQAKARWAHFEESYFALFLRYNQTLPSHLRDARSVFKDLMLFAPVGLAANVATFDVQYWTHRRELESLERRGGARRLVAFHRQEMAAAESRIAGALAAWKLFELMFPEIVQLPDQAQARADLLRTYETFARSMRFDLYVKQFATQMDAVLKQIDRELVTQDHLARAGGL